MAVSCPGCHFQNQETTRFCAQCGTPLRPPQPAASTPSTTPSSSAAPSASAHITETLQTPVRELVTGSTFAGRYQVIEELGRGGMGRVYKVFDTDVKEKVALKLLKPEIAADGETTERFSNELRFARKVSHRNVCRMFDLGRAEGTSYITMEFVPGEDLKRLIRKVGLLSPGKTIFVAKQICEGLSEAHRLGVVHRDLKPQNIMVDEEGNARIMDFGIARSLKGKGITGAGVMIGTPEYMSPEQVEGKDVDERSDIYSLGVILYEMLTGRVPFEGDTPFTIGMKHKGEKPRDPREVNTQVPDDLARVTLKCLEKDRKDRYQSAAEARAELERIEQGLPTTDRIIPRKKSLTSREITVQFTLKKLFVPALVLAVLVAAGALLWRVLPSKRVALPPPDKPTLAILYFENNTGDARLDHWRKGLSELLITDLGQSRYFRVLSGDRIYDILRNLNLLEAKSFSSRDLEEVASRGGATHVLRGGLTRAADTFRLHINLQEARTGELIGSETVTGRGEESFYFMIDDLTRRVKESFNLSAQAIASDIDREVGAITSESPEAFKYYSEARKYHLRLEYREALKLYEAAVALDPDFAMAYRGMAAAFINFGERERSRESIRKALELSHRISERERHLIEGQFYYQSEKTYGQAIEAFNKLLALYPDDVIGNSYLGLIYGALEEWDKALEKRRISFSQQKDILNSQNLTNAYERMGLYKEARQVWEDYLRTNPDSARVRMQLGDNYLFQGKFDLALKETEEAFLLNPRNPNIFLLRGDIYHFKGEFDRSEKEYLKLFATADRTDHLAARMRLAGLYLTQGKVEKGKKEMGQAVALADELGLKMWSTIIFRLYRGYLTAIKDPKEALKDIDEALMGFVEVEEPRWERFALYWKGSCYAQLRSMAEAQRTASDLKERIDRGLNRKAMRYYHSLESAIAIEKKDFSGAIEKSNKAVALLPAQAVIGDEHAFPMELLAAAYFKSGDLDKACQVYEKIASLTTGRTYYGDIYARSFYMLGKIHEQKGERAAAVENYEKFLDIWKDADPDLPEPADAKKRLTRLRARP